jgi:hypothetical protein
MNTGLPVPWSIVPRQSLDDAVGPKIVTHRVSVLSAGVFPPAVVGTKTKTVELTGVPARFEHEPSGSK